MPSSFNSEGGGISVVETLEDGPSWSLSLERLAVSESRFFFCSGEHKSSGSSGTSQSTKGILRVSYGTLTHLWLVLRDSPGLTFLQRACG